MQTSSIESAGLTDLLTWFKGRYGDTPLYAQVIACRGRCLSEAVPPRVVA